ncbi:MAG: hypothetical protein GY909_03315 [Oligoflexia bacterium]|nr:hypothetical protein [Oligoflexia bacterium]
MKKLIAALALSILAFGTSANLPILTFNTEIDCVIPGHGFGCSGDLTLPITVDGFATIKNNTNNFKKKVTTLDDLELTLDAAEALGGKFLVKEGLNNLVVLVANQDTQEITEYKINLNVTVNWDY